MLEHRKDEEGVSTKTVWLQGAGSPVVERSGREEREGRCLHRGSEHGLSKKDSIKKGNMTQDVRA